MNETPPPADPHHAPQQEREQAEHHDAAHEAQLLAQAREHEVGGGDGEVIDSFGATAAQTLASEPARADRDL